MIAEPPVKIWTYDEVALIEDEVRRELYDGEIFEMPSPLIRHQRIIRRLTVFLDAWARQHGGEVFVSPVDLYISATRYFIPDLCFYFAERMEEVERALEASPGKLTLAPDLIIEVISPSTESNDRTRKLRAYAAFGVQNYWLIDPEARTLEAFRLRDDLYFSEAALADEETFAPRDFAGLSMSVTELLD